MQRASCETFLKHSSSKSVIYAMCPLVAYPFLVDLLPPCVGLILCLAGILIPRLRGENVVDVLHLVIPPDLVVHTFPPHGFQSVVCVWQPHPSSVEPVSQ